MRDRKKRQEDKDDTDTYMQRASVDEIKVRVGVGDVPLVEVAQLEAMLGERRRTCEESVRLTCSSGERGWGGGQRGSGDGCYSGAGLTWAGWERGRRR